jgi:hypothetical protein
MKVKVEREKIVRAVRKLVGIEVVIENVDDAREALDLILDRVDFSGDEIVAKLKDIKVTSLREYENSAVDYRILFLLEFVFESDVSINSKVSFINRFQAIFNGV